MCDSCMAYTDSRQNDLFFLMFLTTELYSPIVGFISKSLLSMLLFYEVCHRSKIYLFIDGLKLEKGILDYVCSNARDVLGCTSTCSFPVMPI